MKTFLIILLFRAAALVFSVPQVTEREHYQKFPIPICEKTEGGLVHCWQNHGDDIMQDATGTLHFYGRALATPALATPTEYIPYSATGTRLIW